MTSSVSVTLVIQYNMCNLCVVLLGTATSQLLHNRVQSTDQSMVQSIVQVLYLPFCMGSMN